jgi:hypothetical protein
VVIPYASPPKSNAMGNGPYAARGLIRSEPSMGFLDPAIFNLSCVDRAPFEGREPSAFNENGTFRRLERSKIYETMITLTSRYLATAKVCYKYADSQRWSRLPHPHHAGSAVGYNVPKPFLLRHDPSRTKELRRPAAAFHTQQWPHGPVLRKAM